MCPRDETPRALSSARRRIDHRIPKATTALHPRGGDDQRVEQLVLTEHARHLVGSPPRIDNPAGRCRGCRPAPTPRRRRCQDDRRARDRGYGDSTDQDISGREQWVTSRGPTSPRNRYRSPSAGVVCGGCAGFTASVCLRASFRACFARLRSRSFCSRASFANVVFFLPPEAMAVRPSSEVSRRAPSEPHQPGGRRPAAEQRAAGATRGFRQHPQQCECVS